MNIKKAMRAIIFTGVLALTTTVLAVQVETYNLDPVHSFSFFKVGHLGIGSVIGSFSDMSGTVVLDQDNPSNSSVDVVIKTASVNTHNDQRDADLRSEDFFDVKKYPTMEFKSTNVVKLDDGSYNVTGNFTLHGVTKSITVNAKMVGRGNDPITGGIRGAFEAAFSIKRSDYGMTYMIPAAGDKVDITLTYEGVLKN